MDWLKILENAVYLLALLNPPSKILFLSTYEPELEMRQIWELSWKSSLAALLMLIAFAIVGQFVLEQIFRITSTLTGCPALAPSRSTRWMMCAPSFSQRTACAAGSSP